MNRNGVMVTGSAGLVGSRLCEALAALGHTVIAVYRYMLPQPREGVFPVCSNLQSPDLLGAPLRGVETVVHLAWADGSQGNESSNLTALESVIQAMEDQGTRRLIFLSCLGAGARCNDPFLSEKYDGEVLAFNSKIPEVIVLRSPLVFTTDGSGSKVQQVLQNCLSLPLIYPLPHRDNKLRLIHASDLINAIVHFVGAAAVHSRVIRDLHEAHEFSLRDLLQNQATDTGVAKLPLGSFLGRWVFSGMDWVREIRGGVTVNWLSRLNCEHDTNNDASKEFGSLELFGDELRSLSSP